VGGIFANQNYGGEFIYENLQIQNNLIHGSYTSGIKNLIFLGSSCIYPKNSKQPIKENIYYLENLKKQMNLTLLQKLQG
jgi:GDP-L-fucose synthase